MLKAKTVLRLLATTDATIERLRELMSRERDVQIAAVRRLGIHCAVCKKSSPLRLWTFIQNRYYVHPSGCTEGDYWSDSEFQHCHLVCPSCRRRNRIDFRPDMEPLLAIRKSHHFRNEELFDPKIVVEAERLTW